MILRFFWNNVRIPKIKYAFMHGIIIKCMKYVKNKCYQK